MKILIDIGHPAHVHYFKNFIKIMIKRGHQFLVIAREKDCTNYLLKALNIDFLTRGKGAKSLIGKLLYLFKGDFIMIKNGYKYKPDLLISFGSAYAAHTSKLLGIPHIAFDDTEHAKFEHLMYVPFTDCIITPKSFKKDFGSKHIRFHGTMDIAYLHPKYFQLNNKDLEEYKLENKTFFILRFVDWTASHDRGHYGFSYEGKINLINLLSKFGSIIISAEGYIPKEFRNFLYKGDPLNIHNFLHYAQMFIGESGTMATEAAILGTPSIVVNSSAKNFGVFEFVSKFGNLFYYNNEYEAIDKINRLLNTGNLKAISNSNANNFINQCINLTDFMVWFVENYPKSFKEMKENPEYQYNFR